MTYYSILPGERLQDIVRFFWVLESDQPYTHHSMADVCPEMLFHYNGRFNEVSDAGAGEASFISGVHGQTAATRKFTINSSFGIFGVYFFPQAMPLLFNLPATELTAQMYDLGTLLGPEGSELEERMMTAGSNRQRVEIITAFMERKLASARAEQLPVFSCIRSIIRHKGSSSVRQLAATAFLSERQFERQFKQYTGFAPKLFSKIVRFQAAMSQYGHSDKSLTDIAHECGYFDQAHFIHDFRRFSGHHPRQYFSGSSQATGWRD